MTPPVAQTLLIDSHCHLDNPCFDTDREQVLQRAVQTGVGAVVMPATHASSWEQLKRVAANHPRLFPVYGLHPMFLDHHSLADIDALRDWLAKSGSAAGVGECGLDQYKGGEYRRDLAVQMPYFVAQLEIARDSNLPVVIHARGAVEQVINTIQAANNTLGMVHSYNGSYEQAKKLLDLGFMLGFGGAMTYTRARKLRRLALQLPLDALLLETDSPDQPDARHKGMRNEPAFLREVFNVLCDLRPESPETIARVTSQNAARLFRLPVPTYQPVS